MNRYILKISENSHEIHDVTVNRQTRVEALIYDELDPDDKVAKLAGSIIRTCKQDEECWLFWGAPGLYELNSLSDKLIGDIREMGVKLI